MLDIFLNKCKFLLKSPIALFVYGILSKWYFMIALPALVVTYWVLQGLTAAGVFEIAEKTISSALVDTKSVAKYCVPKILNLNDFWNCLQDPPIYKQDREELELEKTLKDALDFEKYDQSKDPYAE